MKEFAMARKKAGKKIRGSQAVGFGNVAPSLGTASVHRAVKATVYIEGSARRA